MIVLHVSTERQMLIGLKQMSDYTVSVTGSPLTEIGVFVCRELILVHTGRLPLTMVVNNTFI